VGVTIPRVLRQLELPVGIEFHQEQFEMDAPDDQWLPEVGRQGWFVIGHDYHYHANQTEWEAVERYKIGCFYLWGHDAKAWETMRAFLRGLEKIIRAAETIERPFLLYVDRSGGLKERHP
jgi:hypothetical protein